jgi:hypothetical protein
VKRLLLWTAVVGAIGAGTAGAASAGTGAERLPVSCNVAYFPSLGSWGGVAWTPDAPPSVPLDPEGDFVTGGDGTGVFTPSGNMEVHCEGQADPNHFPPFNGRGSCVALRGGEEFGHGARSFRGEGELVVTPGGKVIISCHGSFVGILP